MSLTTDPSHPDLNQPEGPGRQNKIYLVLSTDEIAKGYTRPFRDRYKHTKCGTETTMGYELSATYARNPKFYGATFCVNCGTHYPVAEFTWSKDGETVGS